MPTGPVDMGNTSLYRFFDSKEKLIYVGIAKDALRRLNQHSKGKDWFSAVATVRIERFESRIAALRAEELAIQREKPMANILKSTELSYGDDPTSIVIPPKRQEPPKPQVNVHKIISYNDLQTNHGITYTRRHLYTLEDNRKFPRRVSLGENRIGWLEVEIKNWIEKRTEARLA